MESMRTRSYPLASVTSDRILSRKTQLQGQKLILGLAIAFVFLVLAAK